MKSIFLFAGLLLVPHLAQAIDEDGDGMSDVWQSIYNISSGDIHSDYDEDGFTNLQEALFLTNPHDPSNTIALDISRDTEVQLGWYAMAGLEYHLYSSVDLKHWNLDEALYFDEEGQFTMNADLTQVGANRYWRIALNAAHQMKDEDGDGLLNFEEPLLQTDMSVADSDSDGMQDGYEFLHQLDPHADDSAADPDNDSLTNLEESNLQTNPFLADTDKDGMPDGYESQYGYNALQNDAALDMDEDGLNAIAEYTIESDPTFFNVDTDGDHLADVLEVYLSSKDFSLYNYSSNQYTESVSHNFDPNVADSDDDGISDGDEDPDNDGISIEDEVMTTVIEIHESNRRPAFPPSDLDLTNEEEEILVYNADVYAFVQTDGPAFSGSSSNGIYSWDGCSWTAFWSSDLGYNYSSGTHLKKEVIDPDDFRYRRVYKNEIIQDIRSVESYGISPLNWIGHYYKYSFDFANDPYPWEYEEELHRNEGQVVNVSTATALYSTVPFTEADEYGQPIVENISAQFGTHGSKQYIGHRPGLDRHRIPELYDEALDISTTLNRGVRRITSSQIDYALNDKRDILLGRSYYWVEISGAFMSVQTNQLNMVVAVPNENHLILRKEFIQPFLPSEYQINKIDVIKAEKLTQIEITEDVPAMDDFEVPEVIERPPYGTPIYLKGVEYSLMPVELAPEVLTVNSDFDEGRIDPTTGYAIPDCDDVSGVDRFTGAGNSDISLKAVRNHLNGSYSKDEVVLDDLHKGWFGILPERYEDDFWDGAEVTIRKIDKDNDETGEPETGQVRFYGKWRVLEDRRYVDKYYGIETYDLDTLEPVNLVTEGVNGVDGEGVYGSASTLLTPSGYNEEGIYLEKDEFYMEGVRPGYITLEWRYQKGDIDFKFEQTFLVATEKSLAEWKDEVRYQIRLQSLVSTGQEVDVNNYNPDDGVMLFSSNAQDPQNTPYIQEIYLYYRQLYEQNEDELLWAGMARVAAAPIYAGMYDLQWWATLGSPLVPPLLGTKDSILQEIFIEGLLLEGQKAIFTDKAWAHKAYVASGIWALRHVQENGGREATLYPAWEIIDMGIKTDDFSLIKEGNGQLLEREQRDVVQENYNIISTIYIKPIGTIAGVSFGGSNPTPIANGAVSASEWLSLNSTKNPIPGGPGFRSVVPNGKLNLFQDRWVWTANEANGMLSIWVGDSTDATPYNSARRSSANSQSLFGSAIDYSFSLNATLPNNR